MSLAAVTPPSRTLTLLAVRLLDTPFEPASTASGELFDRTMEHVASALTALVVAPATKLSQPPCIERLHLPPVDGARRRRDQILLRRSVSEGRYPAVVASLREAHTRCGETVIDLALIRKEMPSDTLSALSLASSLLAATARAVEAYRRSADRLRSPGATRSERERQAGIAARAERDLIRRLRRAVELTYGVEDDSGV